jgi:hypothetical protein
MATDLGMAFVPSGGLVEPEGLTHIDEVMGSPTTRGNSQSGYSLWAFDGTDWSMAKDRSAEGYRPSSAPTVPGRFRGQVRAILSIPAES